MRKMLLAFVTTLALLLTLPFTAAAHQEPCGTGTPGHSSYALHHIAPLARTGGLPHVETGPHIPGTHQGYAGLCGVLAP